MHVGRWHWRVVLMVSTSMHSMMRLLLLLLMVLLMVLLMMMVLYHRWRHIRLVIGLMLHQRVWCRVAIAVTMVRAVRLLLLLMIKVARMLYRTLPHLL